MTPPIAIVGAGPCGLMLARLLEMSHIDYIVFDRDSSGNQDRQGGSLDIREGTGQFALKEAGLFDEFQKFARYEDQSLQILDQYGTLAFARTAEGKTDMPEIDRKELRTILLDSVPAHKIQWNSRVKEVAREQDGSMMVRLGDGMEERGFKLVVGTDGAWSKVRPYVTKATPKYAGWCFLQTCVSPDNPIHAEVERQVGRGMCLALGDRKQVITQRMGNGTYNVYASVPVSEGWGRDRSDVDEFNKRCYALLEEQFADWAPELRKRIECGDGDFYAWSLHSLASEEMTWESVPGATLAGDAAHLSTPSGEGVNAAMYDSLQLCQAIVKHGLGSLDDAVVEYEKAMLSRGVALIQKANKMQEKFHAQDAAKKFKDMFMEFQQQAENKT